MSRNEDWGSYCKISYPHYHLRISIIYNDVESNPKSPGLYMIFFVAYVYVNDIPMRNSRD